jgi:phospholipase/carboxylesterase
MAALRDRVALATYGALARRTRNVSLRASYTLRALALAVSLRDRAELHALTELWPSVEGGVYDAEVARLVRDMAAAGFAAEAARLAERETVRYPRAYAFYLLGRSLTLKEAALRALDEARQRADKEGLARLGAAARVRRVELLAADEETMESAVVEAAAVDAEALNERDGFVVASLLLGSPSRFVRAGAIGRLHQLALTAAGWRKRAIVTGSAHADRYGSALSKEESERLAALIGLWPEEREREEALARLAARREPATASANVAVDAVRMLENHRHADACSALAQVTTPTAPAWTAAWLGLAASSARVRAAATALTERLFAHRFFLYPPPPRGFTIYAAPLTRAGRTDLARRAWELGARAREPGAREKWVASMVDEAWRKPESDAAGRIRLLREARAKALLLATLLLMLVVGCSRTQTSPPPPAAAPVQYLERLTGGAQEGDKLPLVVCIHGMGDRPESWLDEWGDFPKRARIVLPRAPDPYGDGFSWFHYPPASSEAMSSEIAKVTERLAATLSAIQRARPTLGKPIVMGFSQGGFLSYAMAVRHGSEIAAAFPISSDLPASLVPTGRAEPNQAPIFAVHGDADTMVNIAPERDAVAKLKDLGFHVELKEYPGVPHTYSPAMRRDVQTRLAATLDDVR